jgi:15-cis-phytoene synthase
MSGQDVADAAASIEQHSKSFAMAAKLLPEDVRYAAVVLYAYCRRTDDMIDLCPEPEQAAQLEQLRAELSEIYAGKPQSDPLLVRFQKVVQQYAVPRVYLDELLLGMRMDTENVRYRTMEDLLLYAYRVAGVVGLMMCHVMGVRETSALRHAAHLGMAMQLSNIARDVHEDWERGRLYIPEALLDAPLQPQLGEPLPRAAAQSLARATERLLQQADEFYRSGDDGVKYLSFRCGIAIRAARLVYSEISTRVREQGCDPFAPRAVVSRGRKLALVAYAFWLSSTRASSLLGRPAPRVPLDFVKDPASVFAVSA